ncbi:MAG: hypothetical protein WBA31_10900 [Candidatus Dormiibacterota bacterium]
MAPAFAGVATMTTQTYCQCSTLHLLSLTGSQQASVTLPANVQPPVEAGPEGLYYVLGSQLMRLGADGSDTQVGEVTVASGGSVTPGPELGALAVAPSATEWAYFQSVSQGGTQTEQVWLGEPKVTPKLLVTTPESSGLASAEFPSGWSYQLLGWQGGSLVLAQVPDGTNTFASQALEVSLVNPQTGTETVVSNSQNCPVAAISTGTEDVCFQQGGGQATEVVTEAAGVSTGTWSLAASSGYGAAAFAPAGNEVVFSNCPSCAATPDSAYLNSRVEVLDIATGSIQQLGGSGLVSGAWVSSSQIVATQYSQLSYARSDSTPLSQVVLLDAATGQVSTLTDDSTSQFLGIATT